MFYTESNLLSALQRDPANPTGPLVPLREPREFWGVEGTLNWRFNKQWGVGGVLTWYDGIRKTATGDTRRIGSRDVPPLLLTGHLDYSPYSWWRNRLQLDYRADRDPFGDSTAFGEGAVDSVLLVHLVTAFDVGPGELQVGVRNLLNEKYFAIPVQADNAGFYWIPEEGTRLTTSYSVQW
jgi:iron complex outermembrane receptor protein